MKFVSAYPCPWPCVGILIRTPSGQRQVVIASNPRKNIDRRRRVLNRDEPRVTRKISCTDPMASMQSRSRATRQAALIAWADNRA
jgi:hypothetical protein